MRAQDALERLLAKIEIDPETGCWLFTGALDQNGYGRIGVNQRAKYAHRLAYERLVVPIPAGLHLDHLCRVRHCVCPDHLEPVTCRENILRGVGIAAINATKTHCINGHEMTPENTYFTGRGAQRYCRECNRQYGRAWAIRQRERRDLVEVAS